MTISVIMTTLLSWFLIILCLSLHACNGRLLLVDSKGLELQHHISAKATEKVKLKVDSCQKGTKKGWVREERHDAPNVKNTMKTEPIQRKLNSAKTDSSFIPKKPPESVSGRAQHKHDDKDSWLSADYTLPKTRPPAHN